MNIELPPHNIYYTYTLDGNIYERVSERFIAIDTETTDLYNCRIVELGAVIFEYGIAVDRFSTLVNTGVPVSPGARAVNHITDDMLKDAPAPKDAYDGFLSFIGDAVDGKTFVVAHNADFDMINITRELTLLGKSSTFFCLDTVKLSRSLTRGVHDHALGTLADHYGIVNKEAHRACADAEVCGELLVRMMQEMSDADEIIRKRNDKNRPRTLELPFCKYLYEILIGTGLDVSRVRFARNNGLYTIQSYYLILEFKITSDYKYVVVEKNKAPEGLPLEPCSNREGIVNGRFVIEKPEDLETIRDYIVACFERAIGFTDEYMGRSYSPKNADFVAWDTGWREDPRDFL